MMVGGEKGCKRVIKNGKRRKEEDKMSVMVDFT